MSDNHSSMRTCPVAALPDHRGVLVAEARILRMTHLKSVLFRSSISFPFSVKL